LEELNETEDYRKQADLLYRLSREFVYENTDSAEIYADKCFVISENKGYTKGIGLSSILYGTIHTLRGKYSEAVESFMKAIKLFETLNDQHYLGVVYYKLAYTYYEMQEYTNSLKYNRMALPLLEKVESGEIGFLYNNIGLVYSDIDRIDSAMYFYNLAIKEGQKNSNDTILLYSFGNIANLYYNNNDLSRAIELYEKVKSLSIKIGDKKSMVVSFLNLSEVYLEACTISKNEREQLRLRRLSILNADSALVLSNEINSLIYKSYAYEQLYLIYKSAGDYKLALTNYELFYEISDSLKQTEQSLAVAKMERDYQKEKQSIELLNIKKTEKKQNIIILIGILGIIIISTLLILLSLLYRKRVLINRLLTEKNENINKQNAKISGQRDKLSELAFELKKLNKTKDKFFSVLAHDLKNPFQSLCGFSELLMHQIKTEDYSNAQKFSEVIHETSYNTYILLENFLNWARVQTGVLKYHPEIINLSEIVKESIEINRYTSEVKQIRIRSKIEESEQVFADRYMMTTTLRNLISNAVKYSNPGGEIVIDSKIENDGYQSINVKDFGVGMKPEVMRDLFKISNYSALGTQEEKGTGLGLIICKEFAVLNKGDLFVSSVLGEGSTFTVKIPTTQTFN